MSTGDSVSVVSQHDQNAECRQRKLFGGISLQHLALAAITIGGWLMVIGWYQATIQDHSRRLDQIEAHQDDQEKILIRIAERVGAKTD